MLALQELRKDGFDLAKTRYKELKPILDEVAFQHPGIEFKNYTHCDVLTFTFPLWIQFSWLS